MLHGAMNACSLGQVAASEYTAERLEDNVLPKETVRMGGLRDEWT